MIFNPTTGKTHGMTLRISPPRNAIPSNHGNGNSPIGVTGVVATNSSSSSCSVAALSPPIGSTHLVSAAASIATARFSLLSTNRTGASASPPTGSSIANFSAIGR